ncbi:rhodanese-like domain-containing protein [uncultured Tateyamaria sp.]|uniref:rhodanese-like domain-containing protein n=1 Tax=uncultured Tateyamaria sp. TaxID=455651 RepID=UPI00263115DF|nr:rhodanese-like domain-containing protein [uncultured Tateyamaria sp.]
MDHGTDSILATELLPLLGTGKAPCLIDVSLPEDITTDPWRLPTARHVPHMEIQNWFALPTQSMPVVTICQKGLKLSHGAAATLRSIGFYARALEGGNTAWCAAHYPHLELKAAATPGSRWVLPTTRDAKACLAAWVIRRWYDPDAKLLWVPSAHAQDVATRFEAHALPETPLAQSFAAKGLICPDLMDFVASVEAIASPVTPLLGMLPNLHERDEDLAQAAMPFLDAAWLLHRQSNRQEVA